MKGLVSLGLMALAISSPASAVTVDATGSGSCFFEALNTACNNTDTNVLASHYASVRPGAFRAEDRNWFAFDIPVGEYVSATLNIWNQIGSYSERNAAYNLYSITDISFAGLMSGPIIGGRGTGDLAFARNSYASVNIHPNGLAAINAAAGGMIKFGGVIDEQQNFYQQFFGGLTGTPAAYLVLETYSPPPPPPPPGVPEPAQWAMMIVGVGLIGGAMRSRNAAGVAEV